MNIPYVVQRVLSTDVWLAVTMLCMYVEPAHTRLAYSKTTQKQMQPLPWAKCHIVCVHTVDMVSCRSLSLPGCAVTKELTCPCQFAHTCE